VGRERDDLAVHLEIDIGSISEKVCQRVFSAVGRSLLLFALNSVLGCQIHLFGYDETRFRGQVEAVNIASWRAF
jgi:hypothetical protein